MPRAAREPAGDDHRVELVHQLLGYRGVGGIRAEVELNAKFFHKIGAARDHALLEFMLGMPYISRPPRGHRAR